MSTHSSQGQEKPTRIRYIASTRISRVEERFITEWISGAGDHAITRRRSAGWWIVTEAPEPYAICVGPVRPPHSPGDPIRLTLELELP